MCSSDLSLSDGINPPVLITDNHAMHIQEHKQLLDSPEARNNPLLVSNALAHMQEHINQLQTGDPNLFSILGIQPLPPPQPQVPQTGGMSMNTSVNPMEQVAGSLPNLPRNPMTGETYQTASGASAVPI